VLVERRAPTGAPTESAGGPGGVIDVRPPTSDAQAVHPPFDYAVYGLRLRSDVRLPVPAAPAFDSRGAPPTADVTYSRAAAGEPAPAPEGTLVASQPCALHGVDMLVHRGPGGARIWHRGLATCLVHPGARRVVVYPEPGADEGALGLLLAGQISVFVLNQLGIPTLHASAAITPHGAVAFLGPKGQGKSTMTAAFLKRGATMLTDDVLPLRVTGEGAFGFPSLPLMKLWPQTAQHTLELTERLPNIVADYEKRLLRLDARYHFAHEPTRLRAFYLLNRYDPQVRDETRISARQLQGREALTALASQLSPGAHLLPSEEAHLLPLLARLLRHAPVHALSYPDGFGHQSEVHDFVVAHAAAVAAGTAGTEGTAHGTDALP
jgi:hypothetical protein